MANFYSPKCFFTLLSLLLYSTGSFAQYCAAGSTTNGCSTGDEYMSNITFGAFSKSTLCETGMYADYTGTDTITVLQGQVVTASVTTGNYFSGDQFYIWIDFNQDGDFTDLGEEFALPSGSATGSGLVSIPITAPAGATRMRVRVNYTGAMSPCGSPSYGEVEDYTIVINAVPSCSNTPIAGTAEGPASVCPTQAFILIDTTSSAASGLTYQWEESPANAGVWTPIAGATNVFYTITGGITAATDYHLVVTCTNGGGTATSNALSVAMSPFYSCYCSPLIGTTLSSSSADNYVTAVDIPGTTLNNPTSAFGNGGYTAYSNSVATQTATLIPGLTYTLNVGMLYPQSDEAAAWIDFDGDGNFGSSEFIPLTSNFTTGASGVFTAPVNATSGLAGLRVRANDWVNTYSSTDACMDDDAGETEDYIVTIASLSSCSGTPVAGTAYGPDSVCAGVSFNMIDTAFTVASGLNFQWESSPAGAGVWTPITGATNTLYTEAAGITAPTDYHLVVTCTNGGGADVSNTFTVGINPLYLCYCSPLTGNPLSSSYVDNFITKVEVPGTSLNNSTSSTNGIGYTLYTGILPNQTATLIPGLTYNINVDIQYSYDFDYSAAWIDFDGDGSFGSSEYIALTNNNITGSSGIFIAPVTATPGLTGLRVRVNDYSNTYAATDACMDDAGGETEDYLITVTSVSPCGGTPVAGTVYGPDSVCTGIAFNMIDTALSVASGLTFQWESSPAGAGVWTAIAGATNSLYTESSGITAPTDYHLVVTCSNGGGTDVSNTFTVGISAFYKCYCSPLTGTTLSSSYLDNFITSVDIPGTTLNNTTSSYGNGYSQFDLSLPSQTAILIPGLTYTLNVGLLYSSDAAAAWVDFDGDGNFGSSEFIALNNGGIGASGTFTAPVTATPGLTGLRVRANDWINTYSSSDACMDDDAGETEDYVITVATLSACAGTPAAGTAFGPATSICPGLPLSLSDTAFSIGLGLTYQWESSPAGSGVWTNISGATTPSYTLNSGIVSATDFHLVVTCANSSGSDISNTVTLSPTSILAPWTYDVESQPANSSSMMVDCWDASPMSSSSAYTWWVSDNGTTPSSGTGPSFAHSGTHFFYTEASNGNFNDDTAMLVTPAINISALTVPMLQFYYHMYGADINRIYISAYNGISWSVVDSIVGQQQTSGSAAWDVRNVVLNGYTGSVQIRFTAIQGTSFAGDICIDDIAIIEAPTCPAPSALATANTTITSTDLSWTENGTATQWSIEYGPTGFAPGSGTLVSATSNPFTLPGLTVATAYDVYVRSVCSSTDSSTQTGPVTVNTTQIPVSSYPYAINWDNGGGGWTYSNGSQANKWYVGAPGDNPSNAFGPTPGGLYISNDGGVTNDYDNSTSSIVHAYRDLDLSSFSSAVPLTFNSYIVGEGDPANGNYYDYLTAWIVPISYEPVPGTDLSSVGSATQIGSNILLETGWTQHLLNIPASATGSTARLVLQWQNDGSSGSAPVKVDNLTIGGFPLVIKLRDVSATNLGAKNRVDWSTESELKSDKFELERSADGRNFTYLATIKAKGEASNYSYVDLSPVTGVNYYRLKMTDAAGAVATSKVVTATVKQGVFTVEAYPNPVSEQLTVQVYGGSDQNATVAITDVTGKVMKVVSVVNGKAEVNMNGLASGVYLVKYTDNNHSQTIKVNKQ